jgi:hypothetical protein
MLRATRSTVNFVSAGRRNPILHKSFSSWSKSLSSPSLVPRGYGGRVATKHTNVSAALGMLGLSKQQPIIMMMMNKTISQQERGMVTLGPMGRGFGQQQDEQSMLARFTDDLTERAVRLNLIF